MFFLFLTSVRCSSAKEFWEGSPLFLNLTTIISVAVLIFSISFFLIKSYIVKKRKIKILHQNLVVSSKEFDPHNDINPDRPLAVFKLRNPKKYAGPSPELLGCIEHITPSVIKTIQKLKRVDLYGSDSGSDSVSDSDQENEPEDL